MTTNQNNNNTSNTDDMHSCVTPKKLYYSVQDKPTTTCFTPLNATLPNEPVEFITTTKLPHAGKEYLCFHINGRYSHAVQCVK